MNIYEQTRILSLNAVLGGESSYQYRRACRYYSSTFNTPLCEVELLPIDYVLSNYYEHIYESMDEDDLENELLQVTGEGDTEDDIDKFIEESEEKEIDRHKRKKIKTLDKNKGYINPKLLKETQSLNHTETTSPNDSLPDVNPTQDLGVGLPGPDDEDPSGEM